jgi:hypothetical protein
MKSLPGSIIIATSLLALGCQDLQVAPPLALAQRNVKGLTTDGDHVYWTTGDGFVRRVSTDGGQIEEVAKGLVAPTHIALDADHVYWTASSSEIGRAPKAGGAQEIVAQGEDGLGTLQLDDNHVYWLRPGNTAGPGMLRKAPKVASAAVDTIAESALDPNSLLLAGSLYFYDPSTTGGSSPSVLAIATDGGGMTQVIGGSFHMVATNGSTICGAGTDPRAVAVNPTSTTQAIVCASLDGGTGTVTSSDDTTGGPRTVASDLGFVVAMTLDDNTIYFVTDDGQVSAVGLNGAAPGDTSVPVVTSSDGTTDSSSSAAGASVVMATGPAGGASITLDATSVYWVHENGDAIFSMPRF